MLSLRQVNHLPQRDVEADFYCKDSPPNTQWGHSSLDLGGDVPRLLAVLTFFSLASGLVPGEAYGVINGFQNSTMSRTETGCVSGCLHCLLKRQAQ